MLRLVQPDRFYGPETVALMGAAFDRVYQSISKQMNGSGNVKETLALIILRLVDQGESDLEGLAGSPFRDWTALTVSQPENTAANKVTNMDKFAARHNIEHFCKKPAEESDVKKRSLLLGMIAEEEAKLAILTTPPVNAKTLKG
jgi:hypothetical protein